MEEKKVPPSSEPQGDPRRKALAHTIASLSMEVGFHQIEKQALDVLVDTLQMFIADLGRTARNYTEVGCRVEPTVGDLSLAMIELGQRIDPVGFRMYARRHNRPITPTPQALPPPRMPQILSAGKRRSLPSYIPDYFPSMPDPHTYIRTPTHKQPLTDYAACREKMSQQKRDVERSLSKFYARTSTCFYFFPDNKDLFPLMSPKPITYHNAIICRDQIFEEEKSFPPINVVRCESSRSLNIPHSIEDDESGSDAQESSLQPTWEIIDNPFLRPPRPVSPSKKASNHK